MPRCKTPDKPAGQAARPVSATPPMRLCEDPCRPPHTSASPLIARWRLTILVDAWKVKDLRSVSLPQAAGQIPGEPGVARTTTWSLSKLAEFLVAEGVVDDISHEGLRVLLREEGVSFQVIKTFKVSNDPDFEAKKNRILELYDLADGKAKPRRGDPMVVFCMDEFGPLNLMPHPGKQWAAVSGRHADPDREPRRRRRATYKRL